MVYDGPMTYRFIMFYPHDLHTVGWWSQEILNYKVRTWTQAWNILWMGQRNPQLKTVVNIPWFPMISHDLEGFNMFEPSKTGAGFRWLTMEALGVSLRDLDHETGLGLLQSSSRVVGAEVDMAICCFGWILFSSIFFLSWYVSAKSNIMHQYASNINVELNAATYDNIC